MDGNFTLEGLKSGDIIEISYVGYATQQITYTGQPSINVTLSEDSEQLEEVVVTALGMKRATKALGRSRCNSFGYEACNKGLGICYDRNER